MSSKKWFHVFSIFLVVFSLIMGVVMVFRGSSMMLEVKLGSGEGEPFISGVFLWDSISNVFVFMVGSVSFMVLKYAYWYMEGEKKLNAFFFTFFVFIFFMFILSVSSSLFWVMLGWDGLGVTSFCLVMFYSNWKSFNSAMITFMVNRFGDFFFLLSIWVYSCFFYSKGSLIWYLMGVFIVLTGMTKSAQVPFSAWLPAAMAAPTPVSSLVHSSTLVTAGVFLISRFFHFFSGASLFLIYLSSVLTIFLSGMSALGENDLKKIIALSTLSHLGFMMFFLSKGLVSVTMVHLLVHAFFKSLLFMCAGVVIHSNFNNQDIRKLTGLNFPLMLVLTIAVLANMGVPFMSGFYSKDMLILTFLKMESNFWVFDSAVLSFSILLTSLYSIRILFTLMKTSNVLVSTEITSMLKYRLLNWMLFSSLFSCSLGGLVVWIVIEPCQEVEMSFFSSNVKLFILWMLFSSLFLMKSGITSLFLYKNAKMWFIYEFSKMFSSSHFNFSKNYLQKVDIKGFLAKTPELHQLSLKEEVFLKLPKKVFFVVLVFLTFFYQTFLLNNYLNFS